LDDSAKDDIFVVKEGQRCAHSHVELGLVRVARAVSFAHAKQTDFGVLNVEAFVLEGATIDRAAELRGLGGGDPAHLQEHSIDDAVHLSAYIAKLLAVRSCVTIAKAQEVSDSSGSDVVEELEVDSVGHVVEGDVELGVLARLGSVDHLLKLVGGKALVNYVHRVVHVGESVQDVGRELLGVSNVFLIVEQDEMVASMVVENALQLIGGPLDVLLPLGFEELKALRAHSLWVLLLQVLDSSHALVEGRVSDFASDSDFHGLLALGRYCGRSHL